MVFGGYNFSEEENHFSIGSYFYLSRIDEQLKMIKIGSILNLITDLFRLEISRYPMAGFNCKKYIFQSKIWGTYLRK